MLVVTHPRTYFRDSGTLHGPAQVVELDDKRAKQLESEGKVSALSAKSKGAKATEEAQKKYAAIATKLFRAEFGTRADAKVSREAVAKAYGTVAGSAIEAESE